MTVYKTWDFEAKDIFVPESGDYSPILRVLSLDDGSMYFGIVNPEGGGRQQRPRLRLSNIIISKNDADRLAFLLRPFSK